MKCKFPAPILPPSPARHSPPERAETRAGCTLAAHAHTAGSHASTTTRASAPPLVSLDTSLRRRRTWRPLISPAGFAVFQFGARS